MDPQDRNKQLCAIAQGWTSWTIRKVVASIQVFKGAALLGKKIADQVSDLLDTIPVIGAAINNLFDLAADLATRGDYDDVIGLISDPDFEAGVVCKMYCSLKESSQSGLTAANFSEARIAVRNWAVGLLPGGPFLTLYGQFFAGFEATIWENDSYARALIHQDERSDDCGIICTSCPDITEWCKLWSFSAGPNGWSGEYGTSWDGGGWVDGSPDAVYIFIGGLPQYTAKRIEVTFNQAWTGNSPRVWVANTVSPQSWEATSGHSGSSTVSVEVNMSGNALYIAADRWAGGVQKYGDMRLVSVKLIGDGPNPFPGGNNC